MTLRETDIRASLLILVNEATRQNRNDAGNIRRACKRLAAGLEYAYRKGHNAHMDILRGHADDIRFLAETLPEQFYYRSHCIDLVDQATAQEETKLLFEGHQKHTLQ